jgi:hypothetical protein
MFWPVQQELDCINRQGLILGKIKFDLSQEKYVFHAANDSLSLSPNEELRIALRIAELESGKYSIPMQDDD